MVGEMMQAQPPQAQPVQQQGPPPVTIDAVVKLLRDDRMRGFRIDVETDSLVEADQNQEKANANELVSALGNFFKEFGPVVQAQPPLAPMVSQLLCFALRRYKVGTELEETVEKAMNEVQQRLMNPPPPQQDPAEQAKTEREQIKSQAEAQKAQAEAQATQAKTQAEQEKAQLEVYHAKLTHESDIQLAREKAAMEKEAAMLDAEMKRRADERAHEMHLAKMDHERQQHAHKMQQSEQQHVQTLQKGEHDSALKKDSSSHDMALKEKQAKGSEQDKKASTESKSKLEKLFADISKAVTSKKKVIRDAKGDLTIEHVDK